MPAHPAPPNASEICRFFEPTDEARLLLCDNLAADTYLALLEKGELYEDALKFRAYGLSKRQAVWWGCLCAWSLGRPDLPVAEANAMTALVRWVLDSNEDNRRAVEKAAEVAGPGTAAGCLALAAFWSGGSMAPVGLPEVNPPPFLTGKTVVATLDLLFAQSEPDQKPVLQRTFLQFASEVAAVPEHWNATAPTARSASSTSHGFR